MECSIVVPHVGLRLAVRGGAADDEVETLHGLRHPGAQAHPVQYLNRAPCRPLANAGLDKRAYQPACAHGQLQFHPRDDGGDAELLHKAADVRGALDSQRAQRHGKRDAESPAMRIESADSHREREAVQLHARRAHVRGITAVESGGRRAAGRGPGPGPRPARRPGRAAGSTVRRAETSLDSSRAGSDLRSRKLDSASPLAIRARLGTRSMCGPGPCSDSQSAQSDSRRSPAERHMSIRLPARPIRRDSDARCTGPLRRIHRRRPSSTRGVSGDASRQEGLGCSTRVRVAADYRRGVCDN